MEKKKINVSIAINASKEKIWRVLLDDETYRQWTSAFHEGSYAETDWQEGSQALFKGPDESGLVSKIVLHQPNEVMVIEHRGLLKAGGVQDLDSPEARQWQGFRETYRLSGQDGAVQLAIDQDMPEEHLASFTAMWKEALQKVKSLSEGER